MKEQSLDLSTLVPWAHLNSIKLNGVTVEDVGEAGLGVKVRQSSMDPLQPLITIPQDLVLCQQTIELESKLNLRLKEVLGALGPFAQTPRGAIMIYLVMQLALEKLQRQGPRHAPSNAWAQYLAFLRPVLVPSCWSEDELQLLGGTSLAAATVAKQSSLEREFDYFKEYTASIAWCRDNWWTDEVISFENWLQVDAWFRSRMLDVPHLGISMVPFLDFCNHRTASNARYDIDSNENVVLFPTSPQFSDGGEEVTIKYKPPQFSMTSLYGKDKSAAEMLFSYGFIEEDRETAGRIVLDLGDMQGMGYDEAYMMAKIQLLTARPKLLLTQTQDSIEWTSEYIWLICVTQEDGLNIRVMQETNGSKHLQAFWNEKILVINDLFNILQESPQWPLYQLRAATLVQQRIQAQLQELSTFDTLGGIEEKSNTYIQYVACKLQRLEKALLEKAVILLENQTKDLLASAPVQDYLRLVQQGGSPDEDEEDIDLT